MLEQLSMLVRQYGEEAVVKNPEIPDEHNNLVMAEATKTISSGLQNVLAGGGLQNILSFFTQGDGSNKGGGIAGLLKNPMVTMMIGHLIGKLTNKYNMSPAQASQVSNSLVPNVLQDLISRTQSQQENDSQFNLDSLIGSLTGGGGAGNGFNLQNLLNQFGGQEEEAPQQRNQLNDLISQIAERAQQNKSAQPGGSGGLGDLIKGFFN